MTLTWNVLKEYIDLDKLLESLELTDYRVQKDELVMSCPLSGHGGIDGSPSFAVNVDKKLYHCFVCGGGTLVDLVKDIQGLDYEEAKQWIRTHGSVGVPDDPKAFVQSVERILFFTPDVKDKKNHVPVFNHNVINKWRDNALEYGMGQAFYSSRGISVTVCHTLNLGFDKNHQRMYHEKVTKTLKQYSGPAAIIPVYIAGNLVGWQERWLTEADYERMYGKDWNLLPDLTIKPEGMGKYTNTDDLPRRQAVYGLSTVMRYVWVVVVESPMTAAYLQSNGIPAVATFGAEPNPEQIQQLRHFNGVYIWSDNDIAGHKASAKIARALDDHTQVYLVPFVPGEKADGNDVPSDKLWDYIKAARPYYEVQLEELMNGV